jgi:adenylate cyclase
MAKEHVQRRLAAILAADVCEYSRLMGADETGTRAQFNRQFEEIIQPAIDEYRGRLVKTMGDGFLVEFGSVVDAVQCASDIQSKVTPKQESEPTDKRMLFRIGIHLGDVIVEGDDIHGDGVNIASRIEGLAEPGGICLSDMVHAGVRNKLSLTYDDLGVQSLKNIADPIQVFGVSLNPSDTDGATGAEAIFRRPAVAVLPFQNLSGDPEQEYFADGLTEDIITALSLWRSFPVIARNSTFGFKGQSPDIRKVGKDLGARYVVEGSVRKAGDRIRVTAQLINAETGHHVWAERYDRKLDDIFALQDEITQRIAATIEPALEQIEQQRVQTRSVHDLAAWESCLRGWALVHEVTKEANVSARELFQRALNIDEQFARAYVGLAFTYYRDLRFYGTDDRQEWGARFFDAARRAVSLDSLDAEAHTMLARAYQTVSGQLENATAEASKAVSINPYNAMANSVLGGMLALGAARYDEGITSFEKAVALNPLDPRNYVYLFQLGIAHLGAARYETALSYAREALRGAPEHIDNIELRILLTAVLGHLGETGEAGAALEPVADRARAYVENHVLFAPSLKETLLEGLQKAGLPR